MGRGLKQGLVAVFASTAVLAAGGLVVYAQQAANPLAEKTAAATSAYGTIQARVGDIESLRADANGKGQTIRQACIDEKLKRAKHNLSAAKTVMDGWALAQNNPDFAQRSLDRLLLMQVYAFVFVEEARACSEVKATAPDQVEIRVDHTVPSGDDGNGATDPVRPPRFERPPLASPL